MSKLFQRFLGVLNQRKQPALILTLSLINTMLFALTSEAQIIPDNSLGDERSVVRNNNLNGVPLKVIRGGATRGSNLFHSFQEFNIQENTGAYFTNPAGIENILTRVTGNNPSSILGLMGVLGQANLFFINPNGVVFGPNAQLDIKGSFVASTADSIVFDNFEFSASNPQQVPLLTINIPIGLRLRENPGEIKVTSNLVGLGVQPGKTLGLIGGDLVIDNGIIFAPGARVELGSILGEGIVNLELNESLKFSYPVELTGGNVGMKNQAIAYVSGTGGGDIIINGATLEIDQSSLFAGVEGETVPETQGGEININAKEKIKLNNGLIANILAEEALGNAGNIEIKTENLEVVNGGLISASSFGEGNGGKVKINATSQIVLDGENSTGVSSRILSEATAKGNALGVEINTGSLEVLNGGVISASTAGEGNGGKVKINATSNIVLDGENSTGISSNISSDVFPEAKGNTSGVEIKTNSLEILNGGKISASSSGIGNAGKVIIEARENILLNGRDSAGIGSLIINDVFSGKTTGNTEGIEIKTGTLEVVNGGQISASSLGAGNAGGVKIEATEKVFLDGEKPRENQLARGIFSDAIAGGKAAGVELKTGNLEIRNGALISASSYAEGDAGKVKIEATENILLDGETNSEEDLTGVSSNILSPTAPGNTEGIEITTKTLEISNGAIISSSSFGQGNTGGVKINASEEIIVVGENKKGVFSGIFSVVRGDAGAAKTGGVEIKTNTLEVRQGGAISASTLGKGDDAGSVKIEATEKVLLDGEKSERLTTISSDVLPDGVGQAGDIEIKTGVLEILNGARISASSFGEGDSGKVTIEAREKIKVDGETNTGRISSILSTVPETAQGNAGEIQIKTKTLELTNGGQISAATLAEGNAGKVTIEATEKIKVDGEGSQGFSSAIVSAVTEEAVGNAGGIEIKTNSLEVSNGGQISASTAGKGNADRVIIEAGEILLNGERSDGFPSGIFSNVRTASAVGNAGGVEINTAQLSLTNKAEISVSTEGDGAAGIIQVNAEKIALENNSQIAASTSGGKGGNISLKVDDLTAREGGVIRSTTAGEADAGSINLEVKENLSLQGNETGIIADTSQNSAGNGGSITVNSPTVNITDGATINVDSQGAGAGGNIEVVAVEINQNNNAVISAQTASTDGGNIDLKVDKNINLNQNSEISTTAGTAQTFGNGGNITAISDFLILSENSNITANAFLGKGGNINLTAQGIFVSPSSGITATSELGVDGVVETNTPDNDPAGGLIDLQQNVVNAEDILARDFCKLSKNSSFYIVGTGGLPPNPHEPLELDDVQVNWIQPALNSTENMEFDPPQPPLLRGELNSATDLLPSSRKIVPARGWVFNEKGEVVLVGYDPTLTQPQRPKWQINCQ